MKVKKGQRVYIKELDSFGEVWDVLPNGIITEVAVINPLAEDKRVLEVIDALSYTIQIAEVVTGLLPMLKQIVVEIKSWFKKEKK